MNPRPTQEWYNKTYKEDFWELKKRGRNNREMIKSQLTKQTLWARKISDYLKSLGFQEKKAPNLLEIGCSYGKIVNDLASKFNGHAWGVEPSDEAINFAKNQVGIKIYAKNMDEVIEKAENKKFDLILFSHCLENLTDPISSLNKVHMLLKDDGFLFIDTPNNFFRRSWHIYHPYCYNINSISELLDQTNFTIKKSLTSGRPKIIFGNLYLSIIASKKSTNNLNNKRNNFPFARMKFGIIAHALLVRGFIRKLNTKIASIFWKIPKKEYMLLQRQITKYVDEMSTTPKK